MLRTRLYILIISVQLESDLLSIRDGLGADFLPLLAICGALGSLLRGLLPLRGEHRLKIVEVLRQILDSVGPLLYKVELIDEAHRLGSQGRPLFENLGDEIGVFKLEVVAIKEVDQRFDQVELVVEFVVDHVVAQEQVGLALRETLLEHLNRVSVVHDVVSEAVDQHSWTADLFSILKVVEPFLKKEVGDGPTDLASAVVHRLDGADQNESKGREFGSEVGGRA